MRLSHSEADLIRDSFREIRAAPQESARVFYSHLFQESPALRGLFVAGMEMQGAKLIHTLEFAVDQIDKWGLLQTAVEDLAIRHIAYGVRREHYPAVGDALQAMLSGRLGSAFTPAMAAAWAKAYGAIASAMITAAYPETDEEGQ